MHSATISADLIYNRIFIFHLGTDKTHVVPELTRGRNHSPKTRLRPVPSKWFLTPWRVPCPETRAFLERLFNIFLMLFRLSKVGPRRPRMIAPPPGGVDLALPA